MSVTYESKSVTVTTFPPLITVAQCGHNIIGVSLILAAEYKPLHKIALLLFLWTLITKQICFSRMLTLTYNNKIL